jgi:folate-dependent phosphoribosylglycinamide formyltransferase PurN
VLNIHPSPAFPGVGIARAFHLRVTGCRSIVGTGIDDGPILMQRAVPVTEDDSLSP